MSRSGPLQTTWPLRLQDQHLLEDLQHPGGTNAFRVGSRNFPIPLVELRKRLANSTNKPLASPDFQSFTEFVQKIAQDIIKLRPQRHFEPVSVDMTCGFTKKAQMTGGQEDTQVRMTCDFSGCKKCLNAFLIRFSICSLFASFLLDHRVAALQVTSAWRQKAQPVFFGMSFSGP